MSGNKSPMLPSPGQMANSTSILQSLFMCNLRGLDETKVPSKCFQLPTESSVLIGRNKFLLEQEQLFIQ